MSTAESRGASEASGFGPIVVMGVSGCGKSSVGERLAGHMGCRFVEGDAIHPPANVEKMRLGVPLDDADRWPWLDVLGRELESPSDVVISCSALKRSYRQHLRISACRPLTFVFLHGTRAVLVSRLTGRKGHFMPLSLLDSQLATLELPTGESDVLTIDIDQPLERIVASAQLALAGRANRGA
jgi:gluconokinase